MITLQMTSLRLFTPCHAHYKVSFELRPLTSLESDVQSSTHDEEPQQPLLLVKLTGYRLLTMTVITTFGTVKAVLAYRGDSVAPNTLDWFIGVFITIM